MLKTAPGTIKNGFALFEFLAVVAVILILLGASLHYFKSLVDDAETLALKSLSANLDTTMAMLRHKWMIEGRPINANGMGEVLLGDKKVYLNTQGWPVTTDNTSIKEGLIPMSCQRLWQLIMTSSNAATVEGESLRGQSNYHISIPDQVSCRYELANFNQAEHYIDYNTQTGNVVLHGQ